MRIEKPKLKYDRLIADGYCVIKDVLQEDMLTRLQDVTDSLLDKQTEDERAAHRSSGSMISVYEHPLFAELVAYPRTLQTLDALGFLRAKWTSGYVISKPPQSPPLFWHQDWWGWDDACSYTPLPQQLFLMYYLVETTPHNGCLRVLKGTHVKRHPMHDILPDAHGENLQRVKNPNHPAYQRLPDEIDVPVQAGDLVIGDSRLLHASHGNQSNQRRTVITLWYHPFFALLPEGLRAQICRLREPRSWAAADYERIAPLTPVYHGDVKPQRWNRLPGQELR